MVSPGNCGHAKKEPGKQVFCDILKDTTGNIAPCIVLQGRGNGCPLENTMQSGDSSVIQQEDAGER